MINPLIVSFLRTLLYFVEVKQSIFLMWETTFARKPQCHAEMEMSTILFHKENKTKLLHRLNSPKKRFEKIAEIRFLIGTGEIICSIC